MRSPFQAFRPDEEADVKHARSIRDLIAQSIRILRGSAIPDTFLGRKTQEPFPREEETD